MATVSRPLNGMLLYGMDYHQPSDSCYQKANQQVLESPFLSVSMNEVNRVNSISVGNTVNYNTCFNMYDLSNPNVTDVTKTHFMANTALHQGSEGVLGYSTTFSGFSLPLRKKHKLQEDVFNYPLKKRRISEKVEVSLSSAAKYHASADYFVSEVSGHCWNQPQPAETTKTPCAIGNSLANTHTSHIEEMEEASDDFWPPSGCRQDDECSRENMAAEEVKTENTAGHLPLLIISDVLKEGLKNGFEESLTKKIVDSMNRPSMELVVWKPQPKFLIDRLQPVSRISKKKTNAENHDSTRPESSSFPDVESIGENQSSNSSTDGNITSMWSRAEEEEMEL